MATHVVILAAGEGKRMKSDLAKVAHSIAGRPMVGWVVEAAVPLDAVSTVVVVGHGADQVRQLLDEDVAAPLQEQQLGTGHATSVGLEAVENLADDDVVVVLYGDTPMVTTELLSALADLQPDETARLVVAEVDDPTGYGRIIRNATGEVSNIVEERDASAEQRAIKEINTGLYAVRAGPLLDSLGQISADNDQGEYYLTDVIGILSAKGDKLVAVQASPQEVVGINAQDQLAEAQRILRARVNQRLMESGVWMLDPERTYIDDSVTVESGARIYPGVHLEGSTTVAAGATVGPDAHVVDSSIGPNAVVRYSVLDSADVGEDCHVGPYASLRPGTVLRKGAKAGTFVETKNTTIGEDAKVPHLSYMGDASIGARTNIGAGTITCNYDGFEKHPTEIGEDAFIGSDTMLIAPVKIGDGAVTGAGSVIADDVPNGALAVERSEQKQIPGYSERRKARKAALDAEE